MGKGDPYMWDKAWRVEATNRREIYPRWIVKRLETLNRS